MVDLIPFADITHLFREFQHTAWRLESRGAYAADLSSDRFRQFQQTGTLVNDPQNPWLANVNKQRALGKRFERVRIVDDPLTENQRYLLASALGRPEDIRQLPRAKAAELDLPTSDFWLFDSKILVTLHFDAEDRTLGVHVSEDANEVVGACQVRDAAWHFASPAEQFEATVPSAV